MRRLAIAGVLVLGLCACGWPYADSVAFGLPSIETGHSGLASNGAGRSATAARAVEGLPEVREAVQSAIDRGHIAGAVAFVAQDGRTLHFEALGEADTGRAMTQDTLFRIASMTKPITSVAVMMLAEQGRLKLDDPIARHLPEFERVRVAAGPGEPVVPERPPTIRDLLTHTSGIPYEFNAPPPLRAPFAKADVADGLGPHDPSLEENMRRIAAVPLAHHPGTAWTYGLNTDVLGRVVEVVSGKPLDRYFTERIFQPLRMNDSRFYAPPDQHARLTAVYRPGADKRVIKVEHGADAVIFSPLRAMARPNYLSGGAGLVSTARDYARFLEMMLGDGQLDGVRLLEPDTVRAMTTNQIGELNCAYTIHGDKFGFGFGVATRRAGEAPGLHSVASIGSYSWGGIYHTFFWVDPAERLIAIVMAQLYPWGDSTLWGDFQKAVYAELPQDGDGAAKVPDEAIGAVANRVEPASSSSHVRRSRLDAKVGTSPDPRTETGRFWRLYWFEPGIESGNPTTNRRFRVNDPFVALDPRFAKRSEVRGNGMLQIAMDEPLASIDAAELALELWGGHPGTARKRVTVNGRSTFAIPEIGTAAGHCTHQYPVLRLDRSDLVQAHNVFQFACDKGSSFWGHFIVDNACLRVGLPPDHARLQDAGLSGFSARVVAPVAGDESIPLRLDVPGEMKSRIAGVDYLGYYDGFDENGDGRNRDWHGMTRSRRPYEHIGTSESNPFRVEWDTRWLPEQASMAVRAIVRFIDPPDLIYETPVLTDLATSPKGVTLHRVRAAELPRAFWSRDNRRASCEIPVDVDPATVESAELRVVIWDGGVEHVESPLEWNAKPLPFRSDGKHDVKSLRLAIEPGDLVRGRNVFSVLSDTTHHGIEVLLPGPELFLRVRSTPASTNR